ncbi:DUF4238 domain-containing protein [Bradyrhizobium sp. U531]|uniref:DUF4238 domain-containing protein n=1 Tax=Bradyrhizobium sp. U531 TaxID=3053458 RepID=UPI003F4448E0
MSAPSKHHYIPVFYLRQWTTNGFLCEMRRVQDKVVVHSKAPDGTGWKKDLYKVEGVAPEFTQHFERAFMHMVDTGAAQAMRSITGGNIDLPVRERDAWIRFLLSLLFRNPEAVAEIQGQVLTLHRESRQRLRENYDELRHPDFPATLEEFDARTDPNAGAIAASNFLQQLMNLEGIANRLVRMRWGRLELWGSRHTLLTSDRPVCLPMRFKKGSIAFLLPISPRIAFTAAEDDSALEALARGDHTEMAFQINRQVVSQARQYVWALDDRALAFVRKHICSLPDRQILSDHARQLSLRRARGGA